MEKVTITQSGTKTLITITDGIDDAVVRKWMVAESKTFKTSAEIDKIIFPNCSDLNNLHLYAGKLSTATLTALSLTANSTIIEVFDAFVTAGFFVGN